MVPHANRQAGAAVGMGRTTAHRAARLPDAPQTLHDFGPDRLEFRVIFAGGTYHGRVPKMGCPPVASSDVKNGRCGETGEHRSEEHTSELQSLMRISYAVFCLKKKNKK